MSIAIIGSGAIGSSVGTLLSRSGHTVFFASRDCGRAEAAARSAGNGASAATIEAALSAADSVVLAVPFLAVADIAAECGSLLSGKTVIDPTNPMGGPEVGFAPLTLPDGLAGSEVQQRILGDARVVKAFNHFRSDDLTALGLQGQGNPDRRVAMFFAGAEDNKPPVAGLIADAGFVPIDVGDLAASRVLQFHDPAFVGSAPLTAEQAHALVSAGAHRTNIN